MIHRKCWGSPDPGRPKFFCRRQLGPLCFQDPVLLCGGLFLLFTGDASGWLRMSLTASLLHEGGHVLMYGLLTRRFPRLDITMTGICLRTAGCGLSRARMWWLAAAGPLANFLAAGVLWLLLGQRATLFRLGFFWANLLVGGFNLLPVPPLDGWQLLRLLWRR